MSNPTSLVVANSGNKYWWANLKGPYRNDGPSMTNNSDIVDRLVKSKAPVMYLKSWQLWHVIKQLG